MKNLKMKLPQKSVVNRYGFSGDVLNILDTTATSQGDPTNTCTTVLTTTHFLK